jgi:hypothetical protein
VSKSGLRTPERADAAEELVDELDDEAAEEPLADHLADDQPGAPADGLCNPAKADTRSG